MHPSISQADLRVLLREADFAARRHARKFGLSRADLDDVRQDLLTDLVARMRGFDPDRGSLGAFAATVLANRAARLALKAGRERQFRGATVSIDETVPASEGETLIDVLAEAQGLSAQLGQPVDAFAVSERRIDLARCIGLLDRKDSALCTALMLTNVDRLADAGFGGRSSIYRRVTQIRLTLIALGLKAV